MKGLILKDFYVLIKQLKIIFIFIVVFALIPGFSSSSFALAYCAMLPITVMAYDERSKWDKLALTMPYTRSQLVLSKYLLGILLTFATMLLVITGNFVYSIFSDKVFGFSEIGKVLLMLCFVLLIMSFMMPVLFKFGVEKGKLFIILFAMVISASSVFILSKIINKSLTGLNLFIEDYFYLFPIFTLVILILSVLISVSIYMKKDF